MAKKSGAKGVHWKTILLVVLLVVIGGIVAWQMSDAPRLNPSTLEALQHAVSTAQSNLDVSQADLDDCLGQPGNEAADCASEQSIVDTYAALLAQAQAAFDAYVSNDGSASDFGSGAEGACENAGGSDGDEDGVCSVSLMGASADCNDGDADVYPGASEVCDDRVDNDCNSFADCADVSVCEGSDSVGVGIFRGVCCGGSAKSVDTFSTDVYHCGSCGNACPGRFTTSGWVADVCTAGRCEVAGCSAPPSARCFGAGTTQDDALGRMADTVGDLLTICGWSIGWDGDAGCISFSRSY